MHAAYPQSLSLIGPCQGLGRRRTRQDFHGCGSFAVPVPASTRLKLWLTVDSRAPVAASSEPVQRSGAPSVLRTGEGQGLDTFLYKRQHDLCLALLTGDKHCRYNDPG